MALFGNLTTTPTFKDPTALLQALSPFAPYLFGGRGVASRSGQASSASNVKVKNGRVVASSTSRSSHGGATVQGGSDAIGLLKGLFGLGGDGGGGGGGDLPWMPRDTQATRDPKTGKWIAPPFKLSDFGSVNDGAGSGRFQGGVLAPGYRADLLKKHLNGAQPGDPDYGRIYSEASRAASAEYAQNLASWRKYAQYQQSLIYQDGVNWKLRGNGNYGAPRSDSALVATKSFVDDNGKNHDIGDDQLFFGNAEGASSARRMLAESPKYKGRDGRTGSFVFRKVPGALSQKVDASQAMEEAGIDKDYFTALKAQEHHAKSASVSSIHDLNEMLKAGKITNAEYRKSMSDFYANRAADREARVGAAARGVQVPAGFKAPPAAPDAVAASAAATEDQKFGVTVDVEASRKAQQGLFNTPGPDGLPSLTTTLQNRREARMGRPQSQPKKEGTIVKIR